MAPISIPRKPLKLIDRVSAINWNRLEALGLVLHK